MLSKITTIYTHIFVWYIISGFMLKIKASDFSETYVPIFNLQSVTFYQHRCVNFGTRIIILLSSLWFVLRR